MRIALAALVPACIIVQEPPRVAPQPQPIVQQPIVQQPIVQQPIEIAQPPPPPVPVRRGWLYAAVPGTGLVAFAIGERGKLAPLGSSPTTGAVPLALAADPAGTRVFVGHHDTKQTSVNVFALDARGAPGHEVDAGKPCVWAWRVAFDPRGELAYYSCGGSIISLNLTDGHSSETPAPSTSGWSNVAVEPRGKYLYVEGTGAHATLVRYELASGVPQNPSQEATAFVYSDLAIARDGRFLYVSGPGDVESFAIDPATGHLTLVSKVNAIAYKLALHPSGRFLFGASNGGGVSEIAIDPATGALTKLVGVPDDTIGQRGATTAGLAIDPAGRFVFAANMDNHIYAFAIAADGTLTNAGVAATVPAFAEALLAL